MLLNPRDLSSLMDQINLKIIRPLILPMVFLKRVNNSLGATTRVKVWPHALPAAMYL